MKTKWVQIDEEFFPFRTQIARAIVVWGYSDDARRMARSNYCNLPPYTPTKTVRFTITPDAQRVVDMLHGLAAPRGKELTMREIVNEALLFARKNRQFGFSRDLSKGDTNTSQE
jgi:hypothetical protein